jgi:Rap1a immunity proteins
MKTALTRIVFPLALFGVVAATGNSGAQELEREKLSFFNGNDVHSWCQSSPSLALGYTAGILDQSARTFADLNLQTGSSVQVDGVIAWEKEMIFGYCEPPNVTAQQVTDVFCGYLRDKPEKRTDGAASLFKDAMQRVWPCKKP